FLPAPPFSPSFSPPPAAPPAVPSFPACSWHFFTSDSSITIVSATSFTERPVCRYLFTCLQFTAPPKLEPADPSDSSATPTTSVTRLMRGPPCGCTQLSCANDAASGNPAGSIPTVRRQGKLRRSGAPPAGGSAPAAGLDTHAPHGVHGSGCGCGLRWC